MTFTPRYDLPKKSPLEGIDLAAWLANKTKESVKSYQDTGIEPELFMTDEESVNWRRNRPEQQRY